MILWPCVATFQNGAQRTACKVFAAPDGTDVWAWNDVTKKAEVLAHSDHGLIVDAETEGGWIVDVDDGTHVRVIVDPKDCGCSHPLKYFRPAVGASVVHADQR